MIAHRGILNEFSYLLRLAQDDAASFQCNTHIHHNQNNYLGRHVGMVRSDNM